MNCLNCNNQGFCICQNQLHINQQSISSAMAQINSVQAQNQYGLQGQNYQGIMQQQINQAFIGGDQDYKLFKKYAHLTDGEMLELYQDELGKMRKSYEEALINLKQNQEIVYQEKKKEFWEWCSKYRKQLTEERAEKLKILT